MITDYDILCDMLGRVARILRIPTKASGYSKQPYGKGSFKYLHIKGLGLANNEYLLTLTLNVYPLEGKHVANFTFQIQSGKKTLSYTFSDAAFALQLEKEAVALGQFEIAEIAAACKSVMQDLDILKPEWHFQAGRSTKVHWGGFLYQYPQIGTPELICNVLGLNPRTAIQPVGDISLNRDFTLKFGGSDFSSGYLICDDSGGQDVEKNAEDALRLFRKYQKHFQKGAA